MASTARAEAGGKVSPFEKRQLHASARGRPRSEREELHQGMTSRAPGGSINFDDSTLNASGSGEVVQTAAEKAREKKLRSDPMADVLGPLFISCKRCGTRIKLSPKSTYDPFHWQKHRERCLKKPVGVVKQRRRPEEADNSGSQTSNMSGWKKAVGSVTPSLTTDDEEDAAIVDHVKEESPSPDLDETNSRAREPLVALRQPDLAFEEYLFRSRRKATRESSPILHDNWQAWSWDQLKAPVWVVASYPDCAEDEDEAGFDQTGTPSQSQNGSAVSSLELISDCPS